MPSGTIQGVTALKRAGKELGPGGSFKHARFRRVDPELRRTDEPWTFQQNPDGYSKRFLAKVAELQKAVK